MMSSLDAQVLEGVPDISLNESQTDALRAVRCLHGVEADETDALDELRNLQDNREAVTGMDRP